MVQLYISIYKPHFTYQFELNLKYNNYKLQPRILESYIITPT